ncbi:dynactin subunit 4 [Anopheles funestus]|uniref:dynactin subunit 4 n=1 Tax=Anopheles funestus TaxID=62324 RepID=UPI0020C7274A|nr:dynactin subunit 4 [Anopheles funestus]
MNRLLFAVKTDSLFSSSYSETVFIGICFFLDNHTEHLETDQIFILLIAMAFFNLLNRVEYACVCGLLNPLTKLYFCRHCMKLRCGFCVCHEVDSNFCSNCLENIPSSETKIRKNRCNTCFNCPSCQHTLSVRASVATVPLAAGTESKESSPAADDPLKAKPDASPAAANAAPSTGPKQVTKKMYYLACLTCRWNSHDIGIPDQTAATGQWPEPEYPNTTRFALLLEHYQSVVLHDKQERQELWRRKAPKKSQFPSLTDRTGLTVSMMRRQMGWSDGKVQLKTTPTSIKESVASEEVDELPEELFQAEVNLKTVTTLAQRLAQPAKQSASVSQLYPQHKLLSIKRSLRCRQCDHNVIKSEYNPSSIKYRIALFAAYHVPDVRLVSCEPLLVDGSEAALLLRITNPTINEMTITIMELPTIEEEQLMIQELKALALESSTTPSVTAGVSHQTTLSSLSPGFVRQGTLLEEPRLIGRAVNGKLKLPDSSFTVNQRDDSAEFDEVVQGHQDEPKFIVWRKANHVIIRLGVQPQSDPSCDKDIVVGFSLQYTYFNTVGEKSVAPSPSTAATSLTGANKEQKWHALNTRIYVNLGKQRIVGAERIEQN